MKEYLAIYHFSDMIEDRVAMFATYADAVEKADGYASAAGFKNSPYYTGYSIKHYTEIAATDFTSAL